MSRLQQCGRKGCRVIEVPGRTWWVIGVRAGYNGRPEFYFMLHDPAILLLKQEWLVCGEACLTRELAGATAELQTRRREAEQQTAVLAEMEKQL